MSKSLPEQDTTASRLVDAIVGDIAALLVPGSGSIVQLLREYKKTKLHEAHEILLQEIKSGNRVLDSDEEKQFVPIAYRYFKAAEEGSTRRKLKLLAKIIRDEIKDSALDFDKFSKLEAGFDGLTTDELICLAELARTTREFVHVLRKPLLLSNEDFDQIKERLRASHPNRFMSDYKMLASFALLSGKGWAIPLIMSVYGESTPPFYTPTNMVVEVMDLIEELDITEGITELDD